MPQFKLNGLTKIIATAIVALMVGWFGNTVISQSKDSIRIEQLEKQSVDTTRKVEELTKVTSKLETNTAVLTEQIKQLNEYLKKNNP